MKIKAAVVDEKGADFKIRDDVELAPMGPDDLQVHMVASGICHSDEALRIGDAVIGYPIVLGHEGSGIVEKVGPEVTQFKPGDVLITPITICPVPGQMAPRTSLKMASRSQTCSTKAPSQLPRSFVNVMRLKLTKILICASLDRLAAAMSQVPEPF